ncbi:hypothetical protein SLS53_004528 [Cytospora paraplurivora]|uniref:Xylanolytic transcriptional activator regulatory domain-containing protein n=1 Tax=Cytospora paraplurivora TaxID=2898453 RepID=A0AAN9UFA2_9PEZI
MLVENRQAFKELKKLVRVANEILPRLMPGFSTKGCPRTLLPDRPSCNAWITQYFQTWGRIYAFMDPAVLVDDLDQTFPLGPEGIADDSLPMLRIFLVVAIGMQDSETDRLLGRRLARYVEDCIHSSTQFRKPCIEVLQLLLLLTIMKTISASDTDGLSNVLVIQTLTSQLVLVMGLHRDPAIFPNLSPYETEMRKRLWGCFLRLGLDHSTRSGTQLILFVDDLDSPLPSSTGLPAFRQSPTASIPEEWENDGQSELDAKFNCFTAKLAKTVMVFQQALCSNVPSRLTLISTTLHSFALITGMCAVVGKPYDVSLQGQWTEIWDHSVSILDQFQNLCQHDVDNASTKIQTMAHQLLWADVARAALCACLAVGNMHRRSLANLISPTAQQTAGIFEQALNRSLTFLMHFWKHRFYLGPVISKLALLLAVAMTVTANLREVPQSKDDSNDNMLRKIGIAVAEEWVNGMRAAMTQQRQSQALINDTNADVIGTSVGSTRSRTTSGSPAINTPNNEDILPREIQRFPEDITTAVGTIVDDGQLLYDVPPASMHCLDSGDMFGMVHFDTADPKLTSEFTQLEDIDFSSDSVQESIREILHELEMAPMDLEFVFGSQS